MKNITLKSSALKILTTLALAASSLFALSTTAHAQTNSENEARNRAITETTMDFGYITMGTGSDAPGCGVFQRNLTEEECAELADNVHGEVMHTGAWGWAPKGCHWNTQHGGIWLNTHGTGSHDNGNYTSMCAMDFSAGQQESIVNAAHDQNFSIVISTPGCDKPNTENISQQDCADLAVGTTQGMHVGNWTWAPKGCHFDVFGQAMFFNRTSVGSNDNENYASVCTFTGSDTHNDAFTGEGADEDETKLYVTDLRLTQNDCPSGYSRVATRDGLNGDLNQDAGGNDIFLCEKKAYTTPDNAITQLFVTNDIHKNGACEDGMTLVTGPGLNADLNEGSGGDWVYLCYGKDLADGAPMQQVVIQEGQHCRYDLGEMPAVTNEDFNGDLNANAGGYDIFVCGDHDEHYNRPNKVNGAITQIFAARQNSCPHGFEAQRMDGVVTMCISKESWRADPITSVRFAFSETKYNTAGGEYTDNWDTGGNHDKYAHYRRIATSNLNGDLQEGGGGATIYFYYARNDYQARNLAEIGFRPNADVAVLTGIRFNEKLTGRELPVTYDAVPTYFK